MLLVHQMICLRRQTLSQIEVQLAKEKKAECATYHVAIVAQLMNEIRRGLIDLKTPSSKEGLPSRNVEVDNEALHSQQIGDVNLSIVEIAVVDSHVLYEKGKGVVDQFTLTESEDEITSLEDRVKGESPVGERTRETHDSLLLDALQSNPGVDVSEIQVEYPVGDVRREEHDESINVGTPMESPDVGEGSVQSRGGESSEENDDDFANIMDVASFAVDMTCDIVIDEFALFITKRQRRCEIFEKFINPQDLPPELFKPTDNNTGIESSMKSLDAVAVCFPRYWKKQMKQSWEELGAKKVETEKVVDPTPPAAPASTPEAEPVVEAPKEIVADEKAIVAPALPPPEEEKEKEKTDDSKALVVVENKTPEPAEEKKEGSIDRDTVLARVATEKRLSLIKAWEESEKSKAENKAQKKVSEIAAWENSKKANLDVELKKIEEKLEKKKAEYTEKMKNKIALLHKEAEEKRAMIEAKRGEDLLKAEEVAAKYRATGTAPKKILGIF
ncbi:hypothetical protein K7X08_035164 [Anisodus acutangulus]|uniref:Remorin n=1 Tax=Anisodus acutangulus TaxID=402998 RepID=A0A9Q1R2B6_9SOLA|nr:hypothetical protein K7X08_035164 [Anisodus acutangulus]